MPLGKAPVARSTLMLLLAVSDWSTDWRMRLASNQRTGGTCSDCGRALIFMPRLLVICMIWMQRSSAEASDRSAGLANRFDWLPESVGCEAESSGAPSAPG